MLAAAARTAARLVARGRRHTPRGFASSAVAAEPPDVIAPGRFTVEELEMQPTATAKPVPSKEALLGMFGKFFSDHMLEADWTADEGWGAPRIHAQGNLEISPAASCLHYALQCFEGMKAYRGADDRLRLFRPELNARRLNSSLRRLVMPEIPEDAFVQCVAKLVAADATWVPPGEGYSAYLRPTVIATDPYLGVNAPSMVKFFALLSPVGPYWPDGFRPITVAAETTAVRAWPGGAGFAKIGGNYAPTIMPQTRAADRSDAQQVLYCTPEGTGDAAPPRHRVTEVGSMNIVVVRRTPDGRTELVTPTLARDDILPGVTRASILDLARAKRADLGLDDVLEQDLYLEDDLIQAHADGRLLEVFGVGTAAIVCPIKSIVLGAGRLDLPTGDDAGRIATSLLEDLTAVHYGRADPFGWSYLVE